MPMHLRIAVRVLLPALLLAALGFSQTPAALTAEQIMARVAANQDASEKLRAEYVYHQHIHVAVHKPHGRLLREETAEYRVLPEQAQTAKELESLTGRYWKHGKYEDFRGEPVPEADSLDGGLVRNFRDDLANRKTKDGMSADLFPLTTEEQKQYTFRLAGEEVVHDRTVYRIEFRPKDSDEITWAGEALIDKEEFQPAIVTTKMAKRLPLFVRMALGTDLPGLGFNVQYRRQPDGVWFPVSFGTEFRLRAVFFINRDISVSLANTNFERTHVKSKIEYEGQEISKPR